PGPGARDCQCFRPACGSHLIHDEVTHMTDANARIDRLEDRLDLLSADRRALERRMDRLDMLHEELRGEMRLIAEVQSHHGQALEGLREKVDALDAKVEALDTKVEALDA